MFKRYIIILWISAGVSGLIFWFNRYRLDRFRAFLEQRREEEEVPTEEFLQIMGRYQEAQDMSLYITIGILALILASAVVRWVWSGTKPADNW